jgi:LysM repeat protein
MFIIPVAGMAKAVMAVTISLQPVAHQGPASYTVRPGDSLSTIAAHAYGRAADWPAVWWANRRQVANPNMIAAGQRLRLPASGRVPAWMARAALAAIPGAAQAAPVSAAQAAPVSAAQAAPVSAPQADPAAPVQAAPVPASSGGANWSAIAACESGGNWGANTGNGFYGGLQFTEQTWLAYGGGQYASSANLASESQQVAVAQGVMAGQGIGAWPVCGAGG